MPPRISTTAKRAFRRIRLNLEELESRDVPSSALPEFTIDHSNFAADHILVRWLDDVPVDSTLSDGREALGNNTYAIDLADGVGIEQAIEYYRNLAGVDFAQADFVISTEKTSNDTYASSQWALSAIGAQTAWNYTTGSNTIIVAVIDTGVDYTHPDLAANIWQNTGEIAGNGIDDDRNGFVDDRFGYDFANNDSNPIDDNGHGTHVAGIIGAVGNNRLGVVGVNWNVKIMSVKFMDANGSGYLSNAVRAVNYAVQMGAKVLNNSWGGGGFDAAMASAITNAQNRGVIFVAAAGNTATNNDVTPQYPANYANSNVVSVAATDSANNLATFSSYGRTTVDIAAPGVSILSTLNGNRYAYYSGTSMATPYVAGAMALVWSLNPNWTYSQVISNVLNNTTSLASLNGKVATGGLLNIGKAITAAAPVVTPPAPTPAPTPAPSITNATFVGGSGFLNGVRITFAAPINSSTFTAADVNITGPNGQRIAVTSISAVVGSNNTQFIANFATQTSIGAYSAKIGPDIRDVSNKLMDQNKNGVAGEAADVFALSGALGGTATFASGTLNQTIADLATLTSSITINQHISISDLKVTVNLRHTYDSDLVIKLVSPTGKEIVLFNRRGGSSDNMTNTTFSDSGTTAVRAAAAPFTGTFRPEMALSAYKNLNAFGTWKLVITDMARYDTGTLVNWSLTVTTGSSSAAARSFDDAGSGEIFADVGEKIIDAGSQPMSSSIQFSANSDSWFWSANHETNFGVVNDHQSSPVARATPVSEPISLDIRTRSSILHVQGIGTDAEVELEVALDSLFIQI